MIYFADENDIGKRLDVLLTEVLPDVSRSKIQSNIKSGFIKVNANLQKSSYIVKEDDNIVVDDVISKPVKIIPQNINLQIVYEDENMLVVNKPSGMLTHPTANEMENTLVNALLYKYGDNLSNINGEFRRGIVHRLDRNTSGLLMIAKNNKTHSLLAEEIKSHRVEKKYRAIVKGIWERDEELVDLPIGRNKKQPNKMTVVSDGKQSQTYVKVIRRFKEITALELTLITGRTHQIRVHMSYMGHPVYNDTLYGSGKGKIKTNEQVLQSFSIRFTKPFSDEIISLEIEPDEEYKKVYNYFEDREK